jgi:hypothetical protein
MHKRLTSIRNANTDGIINGLVTVFAFVPTPKTDQYDKRHPDTLITCNRHLCTKTVSCLRDRLYRDTAPVPIYQLSANETVY